MTPEPLKTLRLGQKVRVAAVLKRTTEYPERGGWGEAHKVWCRDVLPAPVAGVLVGLRTISDGTRVDMGDEGIGYKATAHRPAALVAVGLRTALRLVALDDLTTEEKP